MKIFIWENVGDLTENYHDGGGLVVIAETIDSARAMIEKECSKKCTAKKDVVVLELENEDWGYGNHSYFWRRC